MKTHKTLEELSATIDHEPLGTASLLVGMTATPLGMFLVAASARGITRCTYIGQGHEEAGAHERKKAAEQGQEEAGAHEREKTADQEHKKAAEQGQENGVGQDLVLGGAEPFSDSRYLINPRVTLIQPGDCRAARRHLDQLIEELDEYFRHQRKHFTVELDVADGTQFQRDVWEQLRDVNFGSVVTYGQLAAAVDRPRAYRAVGGACRENRVQIITPCHRVVSSDGTLGGFMGGNAFQAIKQALLEMEGHHFQGGDSAVTEGRGVCPIE